MNPISATIQSADWKAEKHAPAISAPDAAKAGEPVAVSAAVGDAIPHPNTPRHHIAWIALYFLPDGAKLPVELARAEFSAHGASATDVPGPAFTEPRLSATVKLAKSGTLQAVAYCNLHGLWQSEKAISVA